MRHPESKMTSIASLLEELAAHTGAAKSVTWFRGQANKDWKLVPSIARGDESSMAAELTMIKRFKQNAISHLPMPPASDWEWIFLMQHHRARSRLLDWSESPLAATFFAVNDDAAADKDGAVWFLDPVAFNTSTGKRRAFELDIPACGIDADLDDYLPDRVNAKVSDLDPVAVIGPRNSARMVAQAGVFTVMHVRPLPIEEVGESKHVWRMIIPAECKPKIAGELRLLGVNEYTLFPELDRVRTAVDGVFA